MKIVAIGDIGVVGDVMHIGDEAMFDELVVQLRRRNVTQVTAVSSNPAESAARYGVDAVQRIGFGSDAAASVDRADRVIRTAAGEAGLLAADDSAHAVISAIRESDGVAVAGGGNICSTWPTHIFERGTIAALAELFGKPLVVSGQTIGPYLTDDDSERVRVLLSSAGLVGLRESGSFALSKKIGVPDALLANTFDDASFLGFSADEAPDVTPAESTATAAYCAVTLSSHLGGADRDEFDSRLAALLDHISTSFDLDIVFFAHFASLDESLVYGDSVVHERVRSRMLSSRVRVEPTTDSRAAAALSRNAALVVSSRYHPAVFAVAAGTPTIGIPVDDYTTTKLTGALGNFGQESVLPMAALLRGNGPAVAGRVWAERAAIRERGQDIAGRRAVESAAWWDRVAGVLAGK